MTEATAVKQHLEQRFTEQRIVFWHDFAGLYSSDIDDLGLDGVIVARVGNDEYGLKYRLLHDWSEEKVLVYRSGEPATGIANWLLDLELAYGTFTADRGSLMAQDLGLREEVAAEVIREHEKFFNAQKRVQSLKALLSPQDDGARLRAKMCAVLLGQKDHTLLDITRSLLVENASGEHVKFDALAEYGLDAFYWRGASVIYGYRTHSPTLDDFVLWLFKRALEDFRSDALEGLRNIQLDFSSLRYDQRSQAAMATLAKRAEVVLDYETRISGASFAGLVSQDLFEATDRRIITDLARAVTEQRVALREVSDVVRARQASVWIGTYRPLYSAIESAAELLSLVSAVNLAFSSLDDALERYRSELFRIDQLYRQFTHACRAFGAPHPLEPLRDQVEKRYMSAFVFPLGAAVQHHIDGLSEWGSSILSMQSSFYAGRIRQFVDDDKKVVVIVSDALRYEVAEELRSRIRQEDRFDAEIDAMLGVVPSYTQLGMAALLPQSTLQHSADGKAVLADGQPTNGTAMRRKILETVGGTAIQAEDFKALPREERREVFRDNRILYIYHDVIDLTGDKAASERRVFEAAEQAIRELVDLVKTAANANATNILVTADHGFLYQDEELPDQMYLSEGPQGDSILVKNRRFVLGRGLKATDAFRTFTAAQLGLEGDLEVQVAKSVHRLRIAGGGSRFVHGGATLQEVVVPVVTVNKKRKSDTRPVDVRILPETDKITTGQLVVKLFQAEPVSDKVQPRILRAGLWAGETLISNDPPPELNFDSTSTEQRDRYQVVQLLLSRDTDEFNNRSVEFRLEERIPNTNQWKVHEKALYLLKRSFASDFDF